MGRIYEAIRKMKLEDNEQFEDDEHIIYVSFFEFIAILALHSDDSENMIAQYLLSGDDFLKLDYYIYDSIYSQLSNDEIFNTEFRDATEAIKAGILTKYSKYKFHKKKYDETYKNRLEYPTEFFLEQVLEEQIEDELEDKFWKVEDVLDLDCMKAIELNANSFNECRDALNSDAKEVLIFKRKNKDLLEQLLKLEGDGTDELKTELTEAHSIIEKQKIKINALLGEVEKLKQDALPKNDRVLHPRTANNASKIIGALASELLRMDLTKPYAESSNGMIKTSVEMQGNTLSNDVIADWLTLAHENTK